MNDTPPETPPPTPGAAAPADDASRAASPAVPVPPPPPTPPGRAAGGAAGGSDGDPFSFRSLLDAVVDLLRAHPLPLLLPFILFALVTSGGGDGPDVRLDPGSLSPVEWLFLIPLIVLAGIVGLVIFLAILAVGGGLALVTTHAAWEAREGRTPSLREAYHALRPRLVGGILAFALFFIAATLGTFVLILPGAFLLGAWAPWMAIMVREDTPGLEALRRAWHMTRPHWTSLFLMGLAAIGTWLLAGILGIVPIIGSALTSIVHGALYAGYVALGVIVYQRAGAAARTPREQTQG